MKTKERDELITENFGLVHWKAKKWYRRINNVNLDYQDLVGICEIGITKAAKNYNHDKNVKFATFATICIDNEVRMTLRKENKKKKECFLSELEFESEDGEILMPEFLKEKLSVESNEEDFINNSLLRDVLNNLPPTERKMLYYYHVEELTQKELNQKLDLNYSQSYISRMLQELREKTKSLLQKEGVSV